MKKNLIRVVASLLFLVLILPFFVEWLYDIGLSHPVIFTKYTQSEVLNYIATIIGLIVSIIALYFSLFQFAPQLEMKRLSIFCLDNQSPFEALRITNKGTLPVNIVGINLCSSKKVNGRRMMFSSLSWPEGLPQKIDAGDSFDFSLGDQKCLESIIAEFSKALQADGYENNRVIFSIVLATGQHIIYRSKSDEIYNCALGE